MDEIGGIFKKRYPYPKDYQTLGSNESILKFLKIYACKSILYVLNCPDENHRPSAR